MIGFIFINYKMLRLLYEYKVCLHICMYTTCMRVRRWCHRVTDGCELLCRCSQSSLPLRHFSSLKFLSNTKVSLALPTWLCSGTSECINAVLSESHNRPLQHWPRLWGLCSVHSAVGPLSLEHWVHMGNQYALWLIGTSFSYQQFPVLKSQVPLGLSWLLNR